MEVSVATSDFVSARNGKRYRSLVPGAAPALPIGGVIEMSETERGRIYPSECRHRRQIGGLPLRIFPLSGCPLLGTRYWKSS